MAPEIENKLEQHEGDGIAACQEPLSFLFQTAIVQLVIP